MKRRTAIGRIAAGIAGLGVAAGGLKWYSIAHAPDLDYLVASKPLLGALAETIIPATDTPGAKEAGVADFIIMMVRDCAARREQNKFIDGLADLQSYSRRYYGHPYEECKVADQEVILARFEDKGRRLSGTPGKVQDRLLGKSFFSMLKSYTVEGYCTSQAGATRGLAFVAIPGRFEGCVTMQPGQKGWATN